MSGRRLSYEGWDEYECFLAVFRVKIQRIHVECGATYRNSSEISCIQKLESNIDCFRCPL
jgi:hypothetical protein